MKFTGHACGLTLLALLVNVPAGAAPGKEPPPAPRPADASAPRKDAPAPQQKKPAATESIPGIEPRRPGDKLDLGLCDGS